MSSSRESRAEEETRGDQRDPFQRDRDRLLYATSFRRLAGVTQVAGAVEAHVFHNRMTHTLKVAQLARRLAEYFADEAKILGLGPVNPDVVEAAALAHDLGHPPFGHIAEAELNRLVREAGDGEGFEGNAQSFRIVTRLESHRPEYAGLNLTNATLNAILKHPKPRANRLGANDQHEKFGYFFDDRKAFVRARQEMPDGQLSIEAELMDMADSLTYSVHDLDDFVSAGLIPVTELASSEYALDQFIEEWKKAPKPAPDGIEEHKENLRNLLQMYAPDDEAEARYSDPWEKAGSQRAVSSWLINNFIENLSLQEEPRKGRHLVLAEPLDVQQRFLQRLVWHYVIEDGRLATQQYGQARIIRTLFSMFLEGVQSGNLRMLPRLMHRQAKRVVAPDSESDGCVSPARVAADVVCTLTDAQAAHLFRRISGVAIGSVADLAIG